MTKSNLKNFTKGWFIGNFKPTLFKTKKFEIAIKKYNKGDKEIKHYHKKAIEYTIIIKGWVKMNSDIYKTNDIIIIDKKESTDFEALTNVTTCVIKIPCSKNDKYYESKN
jgi:anti-sigma factor ChrR (cupin superfamily)